MDGLGQSRVHSMYLIARYLAVLKSGLWTVHEAIVGSSAMQSPITYVVLYKKQYLLPRCSRLNENLALEILA